MDKTQQPQVMGPASLQEGGAGGLQGEPLLQEGRWVGAMGCPGACHPALPQEYKSRAPGLVLSLYARTYSWFLCLLGRSLAS